MLPQRTILGNKGKRIILQKRTATEVIFILLFALCSISLFGGMLYFAAISCVTGDPFQGLWKFGLNGLWLS
jgi:hypothetical protein